MSNDRYINTKEELYDKCENMEQLYDKYYVPLLNAYNKLLDKKTQQAVEKYAKKLTQSIEKIAKGRIKNE